MIGRQLAGRYEVVEKVGDGGMAVVYKARDTMLNRFVAVKVLRSQFTDDDGFVRRFRREAQAAASLSHHNIVNIYDVGTDGDDQFIVMEYVDGDTLKDVIEREAPLPVEYAIRIMDQICDALDHAHQHQIVHRDVKPHNILITKDGRVKVTDFGIARAITTNTITFAGSVIGSVHYFSPEQAKGLTTDVKSDIYSLGIVLYEMLTGELPFSGESPISVALKHVQETFVEPRAIRPDIPQSVENIVLRATAKDPADRYGSIKELRQDLSMAIVHQDVPKFVASHSVSQDTVVMNPVTDGEKPEIKKRGKGRRALIAFAWIAGLIILVGGGAAAAYGIFTNMFEVKEVMLPSVVGLSYDTAESKLTGLGISQSNIKRVDDWNNQYAAGIVFSQDPQGPIQIKTTRTVTLHVSRGKQTIPMPSLLNHTESDARTMLQSANIPINDPKVFSVEYQTSSTVPPGLVISQQPDPDVPVVPGDTKIHIVVSQEEKTFALPDLSNMTDYQAISKLQQLGLTFGQAFQQPSYTVAPHAVIKSDPPANTQVKKSTTVNLYVSAGYPSDAYQSTYNVRIQLDPGKAPVHVTIKRTDARGQIAVVDENISADKTYPIDLVIQPGGNAVIEVYEDGKQQAQKTIPYQ